MGFERVIAAIDGTRAGFEAGRQAARLLAPGGELLLVAVADPALAIVNRWGPGPIVRPEDAPGGEVLTLATARLDGLAEQSLAAMRAQLPTVDRVREIVREGQAWDELRSVAMQEGADLVAVGSHGGRRLMGAALGSTATELLHAAPCSVLVARPPFDPGAFPSRLVAGVDGSAESLGALDVARELAMAAESTMQAYVLEARGSGIDTTVLERLAQPLRVEYRHIRPVEALVEAAAEVDLLVVGARGLSGGRALGSVSERVAHRANSSVLVVRTRE